MPDSGIAHAIGYANESKVPFARPFIKYTPDLAPLLYADKSEQRNLIARMKLIPVQALINQKKKLLLIDDSIVRGTQLRETTEFLYQSGAKEVHVRPACPPLLYGCKFLNFSRSKSELDLITRRIILEKRGRKRRESTGRVCRSDQRPLRVHVPGNLPPSEFHQPQISPSGRSGRVDRTAEMQNVYLLL